MILRKNQEHIKKLLFTMENVFANSAEKKKQTENNISLTEMILMTNITGFKYYLLLTIDTDGKS